MEACEVPIWLISLSWVIGLTWAICMFATLKVAFGLLKEIRRG